MARWKRSEAAAIALWAVFGLAPVWAQTTLPRVSVVYWTADDCGYCKLWRNGDRFEEFDAEAKRLGVGFATVRKPSLRQADSAYAWTTEAFSAPPVVLTPPMPRLLPSFDLLCNGKKTKRLVGLADWDSFWRSELRRMARDCKAGE